MYLGLAALFSLMSSVALGQDMNDDGCEDAFEPACVHDGAAIDATAILAPGVLVNAQASIGPFLSLHSGVEVGRGARLWGHSSGVQPQTIGENSFIADRAVVGHDSVVGSGAILGRRSNLGGNATVADGVTLSRAITLGTNARLHAGAALGYATTAGDDLVVGALAITGSLVWMGDGVELLPGTVVARGTSIGSESTIGGMIGPEVTFAGGNSVASTARIRKDVVVGQGSTIGDGARISRGVRIGDDVTVQAGVSVPANVEIGEGCVVTTEHRLVRGQILECEPEVRDPATPRISFGSDHGCATDADTNELTCWGSDRWGQASPPDGTYLASSGQTHTGCGLRTDGTLACWGRSYYQIAGYEPAGTYAFVAGYGAAACAFDAAGEKTCWGNLPTTNSDLPPLKMAVGAPIHLCGLQLSDSTPRCVGYGNYGVPTEAPVTTPMLDIGVWDRAACGVREADGAIECWGQDSAIENNIPAGTFEHVAVSNQTACAIDTDGAVHCWGSSGYPYIADRPSSGVWTDIVAGPNVFCATRRDDLIACWGYSPMSDPPFDADGDGLSDSDEIQNHSDPYDTDSDADGISDGDEVHVHGSDPIRSDTDGDGILDLDELDGTHPGAVGPSDPVAADSDGDGADDAEEASRGTDPLVPDHPSPLDKRLSTGNGSACALDPVTNEATCWGNPAQGGGPPPSGSFLGISSYQTSCGRRLDGTVECWGSNGALSASTPGLVSMVEATSKRCALTPRGEVTCWSVGGSDPFAAQPQRSPLSMISTSYYLLCGLQVSDSTPACYGQDINNQVSQTPTTTPMRTLDVGVTGACGIRADTGALACWGTGSVSTSAPATGSYQAVAVSDYHGCALTTEGGITCWGSDYEGSVSHAPTTTDWVALDVGYRFACARRDDDLVHCWGDDAYGQASPPMDADDDGLTDSDEIAVGADPYVQDTDGDGLLDGEEVNTYFTNPNQSDSDGDGITDTAEIDGTFPGAIAPSDPNVVDSDGDGTSDLQEAIDGTDPTVADAVNPYASTLSVGDHHSCAVHPATGELTCWGSTTYDMTTLPADTYWAVGVGYQTTCGLLEDNSLTCAGYTAFSVPTHPPTGFYSAIDLGEYFGCALKPSGEMDCWGSQSHFTIAGPFEPLRQIDSSYQSLCGLRLSDQTPVCYGNNRYRQTLDAPQTVPMIDVSTGEYAACGVRADNGAILCWGDRSTVENNIPAGTFTKVDVGRDHACAIDTAGALHCWGTLPVGTYTEPPAFGEWRDLSLGDYHSCAETTAGGIACWGSDSNGKSTPPFDSDGDGLSDNDELHFGGDPFVIDGDGDGLSDRDEIEVYFSNPSSVDSDGDGLDDGAEVYGTTPGALGPSDPTRTDGDSDGVDDVDEIANGTHPGLPDNAHPTARTTAAGAYATCRVDAAGGMSCVGNPNNGQTNPPATLFWSVDVQFNAGCGITRAGTIECWGTDSRNLLTEPVGQFAKVTAGREDGACAMRSDGSVVCWAMSQFSLPNPFSEPVVDIDMSHHKVCGIRASDRLPECHGGSGSYGLGAPADPQPLSEVSVGYVNACGILEATGAIQCWGSTQYGIRNMPSGAHSYIGVGETHACAIPVGGEGVSCWGNNNANKVSDAPSTGRFEWLTVGVNHSCAMRDDGVEFCWGNNAYGESTVP